MDNEEYLFSFKTKYTKNEYLNFNKFHAYVKYRYVHIAVYIVMLIFFSINLYMQKSIPMIILSAIFVLAYTAIIIALPYIYVHFNKRKLNINMEVHFRVYDDFLSVQTNASDSKVKNYYSNIFKAYETKKYIFIYISKNSAYIINKKCIVGNISTLRKLLKKNIGKKYINVV